ncbi:MAG TPA: hypothetical protein VII43_01230 [Opitutaceae bacterium]
MSSAGPAPPADGRATTNVPPQGGSRGSLGRRAALLCAALAGSALIAWSSLGTRQVPIFGQPQEAYYNLLVHGFRKGSLALDKAVPDALKNAEDPWDPAKRPSNVGAHDISYYGGHYYIYFGVAPVVTLFWPDGKLMQLRAELPSLSALDSAQAPGNGSARFELNGKRVWEEKVPFFPAPSASVAVGRNAADSPAAGDELTCVVADLSQSAR